MRSNRKLLCRDTKVHYLQLQRGLWQRPPFSALFSMSIYIQESLLEVHIRPLPHLGTHQQRETIPGQIPEQGNKGEEISALIKCPKSGPSLFPSSVSQGLHRSMNKGVCSHLHTQILLHEGFSSGISENAAQRKTFPKSWASTFAEGTTCVEDLLSS